MNTWEKISAALKEGVDPVVMLSYSMLSTVVRPEPKRKGPAPKKRIGFFSLYSRVPHGGRKTTTQRCWNPYCRKRITGKYVCGEECKLAAIEHLETALDRLLEQPVGTVEDVPNVPIYDEQGRDRTAATRAAENEVRDRRGRKPKGYRGRQPTPRDEGGRLFERVLREEERRRKEAR